MPFVNPSSPVSRTIVRIGKHFYFRPATAPTGRALLVNTETLEPLMFRVQHGWDLPRREDFQTMLDEGTAVLLFDENLFRELNEEFDLAVAGRFGISRPRDLPQQQ